MFYRNVIDSATNESSGGTGSNFIFLTLQRARNHRGQDQVSRLVGITFEVPTFVVNSFRRYLMMTSDKTGHNNF